MPTRPREHELDTESHTALRQCIPNSWFLREKRDGDYGVDGEIELFSAEKTTTGIVFLYQIKGTDEVDQKKALGLVLKLDTFQYLQSLDLPVLILRYCSADKRLFGKWLNSFDPYYFKGKKSATLRFEPSDELTATRISAIEEELIWIRKLKNGQVPLPVKFDIHPYPKDLFGIAEGQLILRMNQICKSEKCPVQIRHPTKPLSPWELVISVSEIKTSFVGSNGAVLHLPPEYGNIADQYIAPDALCCIGLSFCNLNLSLGSDLLSAVARLSSIVSIPAVVAQVTFFWCKFKNEQAILALANFFLFEKKVPQAANQILTMTLAMWRGPNGAPESVFSLGLVVAKQLAENGNSHDAATIYYNIGNSRSFIGQKRKAFHFYRLAAKADPEYEKRPYYWRELGGILFDLGHYDYSALAYEKAIAIEPADWVIARFADALMFSGKFQNARDQFKKWKNSANEITFSEFHLKKQLLDFIVDKIGIRDQKRDSKKAIDACASALKLPKSEIELGLLKALEFDSLSGNAWFNLGAAANMNGDLDLACIRYIFAALSERGDRQAWAHAFLLSLSVARKDLTITAIIFQAGYYACGDGFIEELFTMTKDQPKGFDRNSFINSITVLAESLPENGSKKVLRIIESSGTYREIN